MMVCWGMVSKFLVLKDFLCAKIFWFSELWHLIHVSAFQPNVQFLLVSCFSLLQFCCFHLLKHELPENGLNLQKGSLWECKGCMSRFNGQKDCYEQIIFIGNVIVCSKKHKTTFIGLRWPFTSPHHPLSWTLHSYILDGSEGLLML